MNKDAPTDQTGTALPGKRRRRSSHAPLQPGIGGLVRWLRQQRGIPIKRLAVESGLSAGHVSSLENGLREPGWRVLRSLAQAFGMRLSDLVRQQEEREEFAAQNA